MIHMILRLIHNANIWTKEIATGIASMSNRKVIALNSSKYHRCPHLHMVEYVRFGIKSL